MSGGGGNLGSAVGFVALDVSKLSRGVAEGTRQLNQLDRAGEQSGKSFRNIGIAAASAGAALSLGLGAAVRTFANFDHTMVGVGASLGGVGTSAGITKEQFDRLRETALQVGADTSLSASEAATAFDVLAKAGVGAEDIINGVGKSAANLAEAIGEGIAPSAEAISAALNTFNLTAADSADITDTLTAAINSSATNLTDFMAGFRNLAPIAAATGISFEEVAGAIAYFTDFGLKGADVGVSLARSLERISAPGSDAAKEIKRLGIEAFNARGEFIGFPALMDELRTALGGASDQARTAAIALIFGAEAADVMTQAVMKGGDGLREMTGQMEPAGQAAEQAAQRMDSLKGSLERMQGSIETALIGLGGALAPTIEHLAGTVEFAADSFSGLPGPMQQVAAGSLAAAAGTALLVAALAQTGSIAATTGARIASMSRTIAASRLAALGLTVALNPITIALTAIAAVGYAVYRSHQQQEQATKDLATAYKLLGDAINEAKLGGDIEQTENLTRLEAQLAEINELGKQLPETFGDWHRAIDKNIDGIGQSFERSGLNVGDYIRRIQEGTLDNEELARAVDLATRAVNTQGVDINRVNGVIADALQGYRIFIRSNGELGHSGDVVIDILTELNENIGDFTETTEEAGQNSNIMGKAWEFAAQGGRDLAEAARAAKEEQEKFNQQLDSTEQAALNAIRGIEDIAPEIDGVQAGFGRVGDSVTDVLLKMDDLGALNLDPAVREALELSSALEAVEADILRVEGAIAENAEDMGMWQGRINLVNETLGTEENHLEHLDELLANNRISQDEYNQIKEAGAFIIERSTGALEDERLEQARQLPILAEYIRQHDAADGAVRGLTAAQEGFIAASKTSEVQTALQTIQLLAYLAAMELIPPEKVTEFIVDAAAADPIVAAFLEDLGLIPPEKDVKVIAEGDKTGIEDVHDALDNLPDSKTIPVHFQTVTEGDQTGGPDTQAAVEIPTTLGAPDTSAVDSIAIPPVDIPTKLEEPDPIDVAQMDPVEIPVEVSDEGVATALGEIDTALTKVDRTVTPVVDVSTDLPLSRLQDVLDKLDDIDVKTATPTVSMSTGTGAASLGIMEDLQTILDALDDIDAKIVEPTISQPSLDLILSATAGVLEDLDAIDKYEAEATLNADIEPFGAVIEQAWTAGSLFDAETFTSDLDGDISPFGSALEQAWRAGTLFANETFTSDLDASNAGAFAALGAILGSISLNWSGRVFSASLSLDTSGAISAAQSAAATIASLIPNSPAEEGPLSRTPSFDYITDAFRAATDDMVDIAHDRLNAVDQAFLRHQRELSMASLIDADGPASFGRSVIGEYLPPFDRTAAQGGNTYITQQLASEELIKLMSNAKKGGALYEATANELTVRRR